MDSNQQPITNLEINKLLTRRDAADFLSISLRTLDQWTSDGKFPFSKIGRRKYYKLSDILNTIDSNRN